MSLPKVSVLYSNGNLLQDVDAVDGIAALCGTGSTAGLLGVPTTVFSLEDAEGKGYTEAAEPTMYRHLKEFYSEVAGNQELHIMIVPDTMTMPQMLDNTNASGAKKLITAALGKVRLLGVFHKPAAGYNGGTEFIDSQVSAAVINAKVFAEARLAELVPLRILIEGRVQNEASSTVFQPKNSSNGYAGVVLGGSDDDGSASVGLALGRAVKFGAHIKVGKVANGPLSISTAYIGTKQLKDIAGLAALHNAGYISLMQHPQKAGFYFGIDRMSSTDDYRLLAYGRVVDKAAVIAAAVYVEDLEGEVAVGADGKIATSVLTHLKAKIIQQINVAMADQISGIDVYINPSQNVINTGKLTVQLRVRPFGYTSFIDVDLGLVAPAI
ncbi:hypothetical protein FAM09_18275 [Niastella caeni]|uniref:DUF2586 family protein n=1 Tax=Niastella caeni TaxID=2569763 RepID=A0A4S8HNF8_9BACT|nr:DUF2586 family protein [Niastella caeni]THU36910.1 hypothetical protein FAM09_18275 [Niastella caeni]